MLLIDADRGSQEEESMRRCYRAMTPTNMSRNQIAWFLIHTKPSKERWVHDQLSETLPEVFLPLLRARVPRWGRLTWSVMPLFPGYVFARLDLEANYCDVK